MTRDGSRTPEGGEDDVDGRVDTNWEALLEELEVKVRSVGKKRMRAWELKGEVEAALRRAEAKSAPGVEDRLDYMLLVLTEKAKQNVCTNTRCPHYDKKCRMR